VRGISFCPRGSVSFEVEWNARKRIANGANCALIWSFGMDEGREGQILESNEKECTTTSKDENRIKPRLYDNSFGRR